MTTYKWAVWRRMLHVELTCYLVWVLAFQAFVLIFQARRGLPLRLKQGQPRLKVGLLAGLGHPQPTHQTH